MLLYEFLQLVSCFTIILLSLPVPNLLVFNFITLCLMSSLYAVENMSPLDMEKNIAPNHNRRRESNMLENDGRSPKENGQQRSNGIEASSKSEQSADKQPDIVDDHPGKSRSTFNSCHTSLIVYAY